MRRKKCPNCGSKATKIINTSEGTSTCQVCKYIEQLSFREIQVDNKNKKGKINNGINIQKRK